MPVFLKKILRGILVVGFMAGCQHKDTLKDKKKDEGVAITVAPVLRKDMPFQILAVGAVEPIRSVSLFSQVGGVLQMAHFKEGQTVKKDAILFTLDPLLYEARVRGEEAKLEKVKVGAENAANQVKRYEGLAQKNYVTQEQFEQATASAAAFQAEIKSAQANLEYVRLEAGYTHIHSPIEGRTGAILITPGNMVRANDATPLVKINQLKPIGVRFAVPERYLTDILLENSKQALVVRAIVKGEKTIEATGTLSFIDNAVERSTGTVSLKAEFSNEDERLWPGQFVEVRVDLRVEKNVLVVPTEAIQTGQKGEAIWVLKGKENVESRPVKLGMGNEKETVIQDGVQAGESVVTDGQWRLSPQSKVSVKG